MQKQILPILFLVVSFVPQLGYSQAIFAPNANYSDKASYVGADSLFVFNVDNTSELYIIADTHTYPSHAISWQKYNAVAGFENLSTNARIDIQKSESTQGYRLTLTGTDTVVSTCWVLINDFSVKILTKDANDTILRDALSSPDCISIGYIELDYTRNPLLYYYPDSTSNYTYTLDLSYASSYTTDKEPTSNYGKLKETSKLKDALRFRIDNSWWKDLEYTISITDDAGLVRSDNIWVTAIRPHAEFTLEYIPLKDKEFFPDRDTLYYYWYGEELYGKNKSAPGYYRFDGSKSENIDSLIWDFGDETSLNTSQKIVPHAYNKYGIFKTYLKVVKYFEYRRECYDEAVEKVAELDIPSLSAPNVFTPPSGENPIWRYADVSITDFEIAIYNRYGRRVHHFEGNIRDWGGWDGSFNKTSNYVSTGVYFYVLKDFSHAALYGKATDDNVPDFTTDDTIYKGTIHVFNTEH